MGRGRRAVLITTLALLAAAIGHPHASAIGGGQTYTVTSTGDAGGIGCAATCTLRQAIETANDNAGTDTIAFNIAGTAPFTIAPTTEYPFITDTVVIDATTQPGFTSCATGPVIELTGSAETVIQPSGFHFTSDGNTVKGFVINDFTGDGLYLQSSDNNTIQCNWIGLDRTGTQKASNTSSGIYMYQSSSNQIGGTTAAERNVISTNFPDIWVRTDSDDNVVEGNYIGTNAAGDANLFTDLNEESNFGVWISFSSNNLVGGTASGAGNVISGHQDAVRIEGLNGFPATNNSVLGNLIGSDATGTQILGNMGNGVFIFSSTDNAIGGTAPGAGNLIVGSGQFGGVNIQEGDDSTNGNAILGNSIHDNDYDDQTLGIALGYSGDPVPNDVGDTDTGPNNLQNYPDLTSATQSGGNIHIQGTLDSAPSTSYHVEFFDNTECDPSGFGEGETLLGTATVTTDVTGHAVIDELVPGTVQQGHAITSTATDPSGNTSEFSECEPRPTADLEVTKVGPSKVAVGDQVPYEITVTNNGPNTAHNVTVIDDLPTPNTFVMATPTALQDDPQHPTQAGWLAGDMQPNETKTFKIVIRPDQRSAENAQLQANGKYPIENDVTVQADEFDPTSNDASADTDVYKCTIKGTKKADTLKGGNKDDVICGMGGNDVVKGGGGNDIVSGGDGKDRLSGGSGDDVLIGDDNTDVASYKGLTAPVAGPTNGVIASLEVHTASSSLGNDEMWLVENLNGSDLNDHLVGDADANTIHGNNGNDQIEGGAGDDTLSGDKGNDEIDGGGGSDKVDCGGGSNDEAVDEPLSPRHCESIV